MSVGKRGGGLKNVDTFHIILIKICCNIFPKFMFLLLLYFVLFFFVISTRSWCGCVIIIIIIIFV